MIRPALSVLALASAAAAQSSTVVSIFLPEFDQQPLAASVIAAQPTATSYLLGCVPSASCDLAGAGPTVVNGPSTFEIHYTEASASGVGPISIDANCDIIAGQAAVCTESINSDVETETLSLIGSLYQAITVTGGLEYLGAATVTGSMTTQGGGTGSTIRPTETVGSEPLPTPLTTGTSSSSNPAAPRMTPQAVVAGVAAVMGGLAMI